jgi:hypothetical protein
MQPLKLMSRMILTGLITALASLFFLVSVPNADQIYNNITYNTTLVALTSVTGYDSFSTGPTAYSLTSVSVVLEGSTAAGHTSVGLYSDASTAPGPLLYAIGNILDTALTTTFTKYDLTLALPYSLAANTRYWIGLVGFATTANWGTTPEASGQPGVSGEYNALQTTVTSNSTGSPYQMEIDATPATAAVPEPSLMVLLCISIMSVAGLRRWWKD